MPSTHQCQVHVVFLRAGKVNVKFALFFDCSEAVMEVCTNTETLASWIDTRLQNSLDSCLELKYAYNRQSFLSFASHPSKCHAASAFFCKKP